MPREFATVSSANSSTTVINSASSVVSATTFMQSTQSGVTRTTSATASTAGGATAATALNLPILATPSPTPTMPVQNGNLPTKSVTVSTAAALTAAAKAAKGGETILLAAGDYGDVRLDNLAPTKAITIKSANPDKDAVFRTLTMTNAHNIVIQDIDISRPMSASENRNGYAVNVQRSSNLTFVGIDVSGSMNNNAHDDGHGLLLNGTRLSVLDSTFTQLGFSVVTTGSDFVFAGNAMTQVRAGLNIAQMQRALVSNNVARDFQANYAAGEHPDAFQVHTGGSFQASSDIIFRNNVIAPGGDAGVGGGVGGIWIRSEAAIPRRHKNILIENNVYEGNFTHGISVLNTDNVTIRNNTVRAGKNEGLVSSILLDNVIGAVVENNVAQRILQNSNPRQAANVGVTIRNHVDLWDVSEKTGVDVSEVFAKPTSALSARLNTNLFTQPGLGNIDFTEFDVRSTSTAARMGAGFKSVAGLGDLAGTAQQQMAQWLPSLDANMAVFG